ncbi:MAG: hypothetical protein JJT89_07275 [Nitriliruptoraceae bacterium]|nr:hypothetical protein [Nitriliruptoraceae bacterium]
MPPKQCPACGRFLRNAFVEGLAETPAPCPGCDEVLDATVVDGGATTQERSVRPPDLEPDLVRDRPRDVLVGWDQDADAEEIASWRADRRPFPTDAVAVVAAALVGGAGGVVSDRARPVRGAVAGMTLGVVLAAAVRRVWRLSD